MLHQSAFRKLPWCGFPSALLNTKLPKNFAIFFWMFEIDRLTSRLLVVIGNFPIFEPRNSTFPDKSQYRQTCIEVETKQKTLIRYPWRIHTLYTERKKYKRNQMLTQMLTQKQTDFHFITSFILINVLACWHIQTKRITTKNIVWDTS